MANNHLSQSASSDDEKHHQWRDLLCWILHGTACYTASGYVVVVKTKIVVMISGWMSWWQLLRHSMMAMIWLPGRWWWWQEIWSLAGVSLNVARAFLVYGGLITGPVTHYFYILLDRLVWMMAVMLAVVMLVMVMALKNWIVHTNIFAKTAHYFFLCDPTFCRISFDWLIITHFQGVPRQWHPLTHSSRPHRPTSLLPGIPSPHPLPTGQA